jgi:O-antigen ligase
MKKSLPVRADWQSQRSFDALFLAVVCVGFVVLGLGLTWLSDELGPRGHYVWQTMIGAAIVGILLFMRQDELLVTGLIAVSVVIDWYLGIHLLATGMALLLLIVFLLARSPRFPWVHPRLLGVWGLFLLLAIPPSLQGAGNYYDATLYFPNDVLGSLLFFWLGTLLARDSANLRRLFFCLSLFGTVIAIHTVIQGAFGALLLDPSANAIYELTNSSLSRVGSFFVDPNWDGTFLAMILPLVLGLFVNTRSAIAKIFYLGEAAFILPALLFTYSIGAVAGAAAGFVVFILFVGQTRYRLLFPAFVLISLMVLLNLFPEPIALFIQHYSDPHELSLRSGAWHTALRVIEAFPLTGVGLGLSNYALKSQPYRVPAQYIPLVHPHDSYLEWAAMAGLPVLLLFLILLGTAFWWALRAWTLADKHVRPVIGGGIAAAAALTINSISINGWTLPPLAALGWLILGACSSSLLTKTLLQKKTEEYSLTQ